MKVLHIGNPAGVATRLSEAQRKLGIESEVVLTYPCSANFKVDHYIPIKMPNPVVGMLRLVKLAKEFDLLHIHGGLASNRIDLTVLRKGFRKPMVVHYHGSECRMGTGLAHQGYADAKVVATPDLLDYVDGTFIPNPMELMPKAMPIVGKYLRIFHAPSNRVLKGTDKVMESYFKTKKTVVLNIYEYYTHDEVMREMAESNLVIDQLNIGSPGMVTFEAMSMGVPPVCHIKDNIRKAYGMPSCLPIQAHTVEELIDVMERYASDPSPLAKMGDEAREWVRDKLDPISIAKRHVAIYEGVM